MPSWEVHRKVCERLLGFYEKEIDEIIDAKMPHDSSRYDVKLLADVVKQIKEKHGTKGLEQFVVHHYLDRILDLEVSRRSGGVLEPAMMEIDPNNILNLFLQSYEALVNTARIAYSGRRKKGKRSEVLDRLERAYEELGYYPELRGELAQLVPRVVSLLKKEFKFVMEAIYEYEKLEKRVGIALKMKELGKAYSEIWKRRI